MVVLAPRGHRGQSTAWSGGDFETVSTLGPVIGGDSETVSTLGPAIGGDSETVSTLGPVIGGQARKDENDMSVTPEVVIGCTRN